MILSPLKANLMATRGRLPIFNLRASMRRRGPADFIGKHFMTLEIGVIGLGKMGTEIATNLVSAERQVIAYVRRPEQVGALSALGIRATMKLETLATCDIVISMLPDDNAVREVMCSVSGLASRLQRGAIHISMSTIGTATAQCLARKHAALDQGYVAAPVFGNPAAAKARQLFIIAAGRSTDLSRCRSLFNSIGQRTFVVGSDPAHANLIKLLGNMMTATALETLAETAAVLLKRGLDPREFIDILTNTMFGGLAHRIYGDRIVRRDYTPGFALPLVLKDVRLALAEAEMAGAPFPSAGVVRDRLITGIARGYADLDWTALGLIAAQEAGLQTEPPAGPANQPLTPA
jgi:3-hydroxyisobutyrate dehydrogenase-like beta-hydroxyacid dehydrogenase